MATAQKIIHPNEEFRGNLREMFIHQRNNGTEIQGDEQYTAYRSFLYGYAANVDPYRALAILEERRATHVEQNERSLKIAEQIRLESQSPSHPNGEAKSRSTLLGEAMGETDWMVNAEYHQEAADEIAKEIKAQRTQLGLDGEMEKASGAKKTNAIDHARGWWQRNVVGEDPAEKETAAKHEQTTAETDHAKQIHAVSKGPSDQELREAALKAKREYRASQRAETIEQIGERPGVETKFQAHRIYYEAKVRQLVKPWLSSSEAIDKAYDKFADRRAEKLIADYWKQQKHLSHANTNVSALFWSPKEFRALKRSEAIKAELRNLRPSVAEEHKAVRLSDGSVTLRNGPVEQVSAGVNTEKGAGKTVFSEGFKAEPAPRQELVPSPDEQARRNALVAAKDLRLGVRPDGYESTASKALYSKIVEQLSREGTTTVRLTTHYAGNDYKAARDTHAAAVDKNMDVIEAVRQAGIGVDTGEAKLTTDLKKKTDVTKDLAMQNGNEMASAEVSVS